MDIRIKEQNGVSCAVLRGDEVLMRDVQSALDLMMTVYYEAGCNRIALFQENLPGDFFVLRTGLAGEVLQKFMNYHMKLAVIGDFSAVASKPLRDFIFESNNGRDVFFAASEEEAVERLCKA
ncbi:MAG: DUF4180 domain-containing protein [Oscillospiraceae bacterium]|jgi:hypothetical protein|nr:DUF4180 domain-containing protein [Oscillospiraceae bacterium]